MSGEDEASELRRRLREMTEALGGVAKENTGLRQELQGLKEWIANMDACCFGCPACHGDHRGGLWITVLRRPVFVGVTEFRRAMICPETGKSILLDDKGQEAACG